MAIGFDGSSPASLAARSKYPPPSVAFHFGALYCAVAVSIEPTHEIASPLLAIAFAPLIVVIIATTVAVVVAASIPIAIVVAVATTLVIAVLRMGWRCGQRQHQT